MTIWQQVPTSPNRRAYATPELRDYGTMRELTAGGSGSPAEQGQGGGPATRQRP